MKQVTIHAAKTHLSRLIEEAVAGEDVVIARDRVPVARLVPVRPPERKRKFGALKNSLSVPPGFFDPLPKDELDAWED
ncbi:MAG: type II toxin-antitoxin system Phd/YefM family antitoxin [Rhodospirillales bacterium]|jgi:prevent-host-death family protein|nr:type II toxin-antitoxin system Phd/YefM family antitoxin [Rhodospirillales bacterium]